MNKKGFISISALYSFFLVFCLLLILIMTTYSDNRINFKMIKNDAKKWAYDKSILKNRYETLPDNPIIKPPDDPSKPGTPDNPGTDPDPVIPDTPTITNEGYKTVLINNGGGATTYDEAISYINGKGRPSFNKISTTNEGMYSSMDNYGTSYYFRGAVDNNWVKYGITKNGYDMYWRIIRINGNNTIRMIYSGINAPTSFSRVVMTSDTAIGTSSFNTSITGAEYVGYMYEKKSQHNNSLNSTIKTEIDNWFETTSLKNDSNVYGAMFCSDRSTSSSTWSSKPASNLIFNGNRRTTSSSPYPNLWCENNSDMLTSSGGKLTYPVGLITADEIIMAGGHVSLANNNYYLYSGTSYYTITPSYVAKGPAPYVFTMNYTGYITSTKVNTISYIRPVINLSSSVKFTGTGTYNDVYEVAE